MHSCRKGGTSGERELGLFGPLGNTWILQPRMKYLSALLWNVEHFASTTSKEKVRVCQTSTFLRLFTQENVSISQT